MNTNNNIPSELFSKRTLFTLNGASFCVWLITSTIGKISDSIPDSYFKWLGLIVAIFLAYSGAIKNNKKRISVQKGTIIFFNGILIYVTACGINSISNGTIFENKLKDAVVL